MDIYIKTEKQLYNVNSFRIQESDKKGYLLQGHLVGNDRWVNVRNFTNEMLAKECLSEIAKKVAERRDVLYID